LGIEGTLFFTGPKGGLFFSTRLGQIGYKTETGVETVPN